MPQLWPSCEQLCEGTRRTDRMPGLRHHSDLVAMKSVFISALCWQTALGTSWTKHKPTGHKQLLLLVSWLNASLCMFVIRRKREETKTPLIMASTTLTTQTDAYSIKYWTCSPHRFTWLALLILGKKPVIFAVHFTYHSWAKTFPCVRVCFCLWSYGWSILFQRTLWLNQCVISNAKIYNLPIKLHTVSIFVCQISIWLA